MHLNAPRFSGLIYFYCTKKYIKVAMPYFIASWYLFRFSWCTSR
jgi:hypothetical protein